MRETENSARQFDRISHKPRGILEDKYLEQPNGGETEYLDQRPFQDPEVIGNNLIGSIEWLNGWLGHYDGRAIDRGCRERF
jgi:hypothetical protein